MKRGWFFGGSRKGRKRRQGKVGRQAKEKGEEKIS